MFSIKRFMGRKYNDPTVQHDIELVPYKVSAASKWRRPGAHGGQGVCAARDRRDDPAEDQAGRRSVFG